MSADQAARLANYEAKECPEVAKPRNRLLDYLVYLGVRIAVAGLQMVPIASGYGFARLIAWLAYHIDRRHREVALANLEHAFGNRFGAAERDRMVRAVYDHFARVIVEIAVIPRKLRVHNWKRYAHLADVAEAVGCVLSNRPTLIVTGHFGNWEMAGYLLAALGIKSYAIARDLDNRYLHDFLLRFRQWSGQTILSKSGDFDRIQQVLVERGVLISVGDQSAGPRGYFVEFFGRPASTHKAIAILAMKYNARVLVGYAYRDRPGFHYRVGCSRALEPQDYAQRANPAVTLTQAFTRLLEDVIRKAPHQYLWLHSRWKHSPPAKPAARRAA